MYATDVYRQHGDQRNAITDPIRDKSAWTRARVNVIKSVKLINVAWLSNGKNICLEMNGKKNTKSKLS